MEETKNENEEKENQNGSVPNPEKKPKLEVTLGEDRPSGENLQARKALKI